MKVRVHPADEWGCGHYRIIWPAQALRAQGHDVDIVPPGADPGLAGTVIGSRVMDLHIAPHAEADVYVFQRPTHVLHLQLVQLLRAAGRTVVVDMDDDLTCISPKNAVFHMLNPAQSPHNNWRHATEACAAASLVTVSTVELQRRYGFARSRILRNCIPKAMLAVRGDPNAEPIWGWAGALGSHADDLPLLGAAVAALRRTGVGFMVVGPQEGTGRALGLSEDPPATGPVPIDQWAASIARLRVGAAPLGDTRFNRAKSWLKPLEYAAVGVPWVGSNLAEYRELAQLGAGQLVGQRARDWTAAVRRLMTDDAAWVEASQRCRAVAARVTIEEHAWRWWETWEAARQLDLGRPASIAAAP